MASSNIDPPYYILLSQSSLPGPSSTNPTSTAFVHPVIEYHFADDPPANLLPTSPSESVIILDYDGPDETPVAESLEKNLAITGVKVTDAPGASAARDGESRRNDQIYVIETISGVDGSVEEVSAHHPDNPQLILAQFKERQKCALKESPRYAVSPNSDRKSPAVAVVENVLEISKGSHDTLRHGKSSMMSEK